MIVRIPGIRYSCKLRLASTAGLDPLAEFFHEHVLQHERSIETLTSSFGLPARVIEDVLADLVKRNFAVLDLVKGEIRPLAKPSERRLYRSGDQIDIWQDDATGALLPARMVEKFGYRPRGEATTIDRMWQRRVDFLDAPDARIISALRAVDPTIMVAADPGYVLDSIQDRKREEEFDLYLETQIVDMGDESVECLADRSLPHWLLRAWTKAYLWASGQPEVDDFHVARAQKTKSLRVLEELNLRTHIENWEAEFQHSVAGKPAPSKPEELEELDRCKLALKDRIEKAGCAYVARPHQSGHVAEMIQQARSYVAVVGQGFSQDARRVMEAEALLCKPPVQLVIVDGTGRGEDAAHAIEAAAMAGGPIVLSTPGRLCFEAVIRDGEEVRFGSPRLLLSTAPAISLYSPAAAEAVVSAVVEEMQYLEGGWWARRQLRANETVASSPGREQPRRLVQGLLELHELIVETFVRYHTECEEGGAEVDTGEGAGENNRPVEERSLNEIEPLLQAGATLWKEEFEAEYQDGLNTIISVPGADLAGVLLEALELSEGGQRDIELIVRNPKDLEQSGLRAALLRALKNRMRIGLYLAPEEEGGEPGDDEKAALTALGRSLDDHNLRVGKCRSPLPFTLIIEPRFVVIGGGPTLGMTDGTNIAMAIEGPELVKAIQALLVEGLG